MDPLTYKKRLKNIWDSKVRRKRDFEVKKLPETQVKLEPSIADDSNPMDKTVLLLVLRLNLLEILNKNV